MKPSILYQGVLVAVASSATIALLTQAWTWIAAVQFAPDTLLLSALMTLLAAIMMTLIIRTDHSMKLRLDLLFRMGYQAPFVQEIREDEEEKELFIASVLRKLKDLSELNHAYRDERLCSYYIGCLAFLANEKRANVPWKRFRDELVKYFADEITKGKIAPHVIEDHYKGRWSDLIEAAERARVRRKRGVAFARLRKVGAKD